MNKKSISIVIVEYHSLDEIRRAVPVILNAVPRSEIIVSSNSQYDKQMQNSLQEEFSGCTWVFNPKNGGFAYAMNRGLEAATGDILVISNPDCMINHGIEEMAEFLCMHPEVGAVAPRIVDEEGRIQDSARPYVSLPGYILRQVKRVILRKEAVLENEFDYTKVQTVDWTIGAFIMVSRTAYESTKGLCEDYFMYAEDLDWCTRIRKSGLEVVYYPKAEIVYKGSRSARKSIKYMKIFIKSHLHYWKKFGFFYGYPKRKQIEFN